MDAREFLNQPFRYKQANVKGPFDVALLNALISVLGVDTSQGWGARENAAYLLLQQMVTEYWAAPRPTITKGICGYDDMGTPCE